jgi:hypothetical protein
LRHLPPRPFVLSLIATVALLLAPSVASAAWTVPPTPNAPGATGTRLNAVDCSSANSCLAVGSAEVFMGALGGPGTVTYSTVAERWDGTSWQMVPTPDPFTATPISLNGVSCPRPNVCFAVGSSGYPTSAPLIERWNGTSWSHQQSPDVGNGGLSAVSCSGLLACTAIGGTDAAGTLAERWDGTWHVQSIPDALVSPPGGLADVSCPLKRTCTTVGQSNGPTNPVPLVERWFGRVNSWGLQSAPEPEGAFGAEFRGVSCPSGPVCFAVGDSFANLRPDFTADITTLAERRVGSNWSVMPTPNPGPSSSGHPLANLFDVSCPTVRACHAVGDGYVSTGEIAIAERFDGGSWQLETIPYPYSGSPHLAGVSCPSRLFCMAVGSVFGAVQFTGTVAAKWTP